MRTAKSRDFSFTSLLRSKRCSFYVALSLVSGFLVLSFLVSSPTYGRFRFQCDSFISPPAVTSSNPADMAARTIPIGELTKDGYFPPCPSNWTHHIPCYDPNIAVHFPFADNVFRERHCPPPSARPRCLIPPPPGYQRAPPWPDSLWSVWRNNVPHSKMLKDPRNVLWMELRGNTWHFPHALTAMPETDGAERYVAQLRNFIPFGSRLHTALDIGAGMGGFAVELLRQGMITVSLGPRDGFRGQAQFALERGLPALVGILATMRLPFPPLAFDLVHCSHCQVPFGLPNGTHLAEVDRVLRPGGFFVLAGPPVRWAGRAAEWRALRDKARALCWRLVLVVPHVAIWRKSRGVEVAGGSGGSGGSGGERRWCPGAKEYREAEQEGGGTGEREEEGGSEREEVEDSQEEGAEREEGGVEREEGEAESEEGGGNREEGGAERDVGGAEREEGGAERDELGGDVMGEEEGEEKREEEAGGGEGEMGAEVCAADDQPDAVWYSPLQSCAIRPPPSAWSLPPWPHRLWFASPRIYASPLMHPPPAPPPNAVEGGAGGRGEEKGKGKGGRRGKGKGRKGRGKGGKRRSENGGNEVRAEGSTEEDRGTKDVEDKGAKEGEERTEQQVRESSSEAVPAAAGAGGGGGGAAAAAAAAAGGGGRRRLLSSDVHGDGGAAHGERDGNSEGGGEGSGADGTGSSSSEDGRGGSRASAAVDASAAAAGGGDAEGRQRAEGEQQEEEGDMRKALKAEQQKSVMNTASSQYSKRQGTALAALSPEQKRMNMETRRWGTRLAHYESLFLGDLLGYQGRRKRHEGAEGDGGEAKAEESEESKEKGRSKEESGEGRGRSKEESGPGKVRNVLDMNAGVGSFAAALQGREEDGEERVWVMNVVPVSSRLNTLSAVFDRGLVGTVHDWCEAFASYPRAYDLVHSQGVSSSFDPDRCDIDDVIIEVDRLLRPGGTVIVRDLPAVLEGVQRAARAAHWNVTAHPPEKGSSREHLLVARKPLWKVDYYKGVIEIVDADL
ncbi:unnamed protein product [Closterium sp. Naga37s-1]|nr:unnamed protein product [Closterium sp. Naga37s-1]